MTDPAIGAFGAVTLIVVLALRYGAFASTSAAPLVVGALWCGSRSAMAVTVRRGRYADPGGMASAFIGPVPSGEPDGTGRRGAGERHAHGAAVPAGVGLVVSVVLVVVGSGAHGVAVLGAEALGFGAVVALAYRRLGGYTGDVLGAAGVVGETVGLLLLAAKW